VRGSGNHTEKKILHDPNLGRRMLGLVPHLFNVVRKRVSAIAPELMLDAIKTLGDCATLGIYTDGGVKTTSNTINRVQNTKQRSNTRDDSTNRDD
jgi:hypothetical protein